MRFRVSAGIKPSNNIHVSFEISPGGKSAEVTRGILIVQDEYFYLYMIHGREISTCFLFVAPSKVETKLDRNPKARFVKLNLELSWAQSGFHQFL